MSEVEGEIRTWELWTGKVCNCITRFLIADFKEGKTATFDKSVMGSTTVKPLYIGSLYDEYLPPPDRLSSTNFWACHRI